MVGVNIPLAFWSKDKFTGKVEENKINISTAEEQLKRFQKYGCKPGTECAC